MKKSISIVLLFLAISCQQQKQPTLAFYYWKTIFRLSPVERNALSQNNINKIYLRYFDVALHPKTKIPFPDAVLLFEEPTTGLTIVPVIYIKNEVMLNETLDSKDLASKITGLIDQINNKKQIRIKEIQIDCDWTLNSRDRYLDFISEFKKANPSTILSATIRLHQVKYFNETKVPQVDKGVLMYYNVGKIGPNHSNSIYDPKIAARYLKSLKKYPLPLDVALPIYSWGIQVRNNRVIGLKSKINEHDMSKDVNFVATDNHFFKAKSGNYRNGIFYKKGDLIKMEAVSEADLTEMLADLKENLKENPKEIILYDLDELNLKTYEKDIFAKISSSF